MTQKKIWTWFEETTLGQVSAVFIAAAIFWVFIIPIYWLAGGTSSWLESIYDHLHLSFLVDWFRNVNK